MIKRAQKLSPPGLVQKKLSLVTAKLNVTDNSASMGSVRRNKEFIIYPDQIKHELQTGETFYITKIGKFTQDKIKVKI